MTGKADHARPPYRSEPPMTDLAARELFRALPAIIWLIRGPASSARYMCPPTDTGRTK